MKNSLLLLTTLLFLALPRALGHGSATLGPNGGRVVEFGSNPPRHGEVVRQQDQFIVILLDKDLKPVELKEQSLSVSAGDRKQPQKPTVTQANGRFVFAAPKGESYDVVLRLKENPNAKALTARFTYDAETCSACKKPEWLCQCAAKP